MRSLHLPYMGGRSTPKRSYFKRSVLASAAWRVLLGTMWVKFHRSQLRPLEDARRVAWHSDGLAVAFHLGYLSLFCGLWLIAPWKSYTPVVDYLAQYVPEGFQGAVFLLLGRAMLLAVAALERKRVTRVALCMFGAWFYLFANNVAINWSALSTPILAYAWVRCLWVYFQVCPPACNYPTTCKGDNKCRSTRTITSD